jgi:hypothetical protein
MGLVAERLLLEDALEGLDAELTVSSFFGARWLIL